MKKIILFLLLLSSLYADARPYIGTHIGVYNETFSGVDTTNASTVANLSVGYGNRKSYAVEFSLNYLNNNAQIFSTSNKDGNRLGFDIDLIKAFDFNSYIFPFVKVGFGSGIQTIERANQNSLSYGSFQLALGTYVPLGEHFDIEAGYEIRHLSYEDVNLGTTRKSYTSVMNTLYLGINYRF